MAPGMALGTALELELGAPVSTGMQAMPQGMQRRGAKPLPPAVVVIWIDWYAYHVGRFMGLDAAPALRGRVAGIEMVGGVGVHAGLKFREALPESLAIETLMPDSDWRSANKWQLSVELWKRLSRLDPEVVLVPGYYTLPAVAAALWARLHGRASVLMTESTAYDHVRVPWKETLKSVAVRLLFGWAVSGGKDHVAYLRQLRFPENRVVGFYDVVNNGLFREGTSAVRAGTRREDHGLPKERYFLYVGRLAEEKNIAGLLQSWITYRESGGLWPLVLVGDGPERAALEAAAGRTPYAHEVYFPGLRSSRELLPFYAFAGCFVLPSTREPWGLVVNEAMASGLPVIVSGRCGCARDLVRPGVNGFVFHPERPEELTAALHTISAAGAEKLQGMGESSAEQIREYSPESFGLEIARIVAERERTAKAGAVWGGPR